MRTEVYDGLSIQEIMPNVPRVEGMTSFISDKQVIPLTEKVLSKHTLFIGTTGTGKTTAINQMLRQLIRKMTDQDVMIIFDTKGDFKKSFFRSGKDTVLSNDGASTAIWNLFQEGLADGDKQIEQNMMEITASLFDERIRRSSSPFFPQAARDVLYGIIMYLYYANHKSYPELLNNEELYHFLCEAGIDEVIDRFGRFADLRGIIDYIYSGDTSEQSQGVYSELRMLVNEILIGNFKKNGSFSVRQFVRRKGGRILFIEYDMAIGTILAPIYKCIYDLAIKEALSRSAGEKGNVFFVIDEFKLLPNLSHMDDGVNFGRGLGAKFIVAMQNIPQIIHAYGREKAESILSAFGTLVAFKVTDRDSIRFVQDHFGRNKKKYSLRSSSYTGGNVEETGYGQAVEDWDILQLEPGHAFITVSDYSPMPVRFHFKEE